VKTAEDPLEKKPSLECGDLSPLLVDSHSPLKSGDKSPLLVDSHSPLKSGDKSPHSKDKSPHSKEKTLFTQAQPVSGYALTCRGRFEFVQVKRPQLQSSCFRLAWGSAEPRVYCLGRDNSSNKSAEVKRQ